MNTFSKVWAATRNRRNTEAGETSIGLLTAIAGFVVLGVGATTLIVSANNIHDIAVEKVTSTSGDLNAIQAIDRDFRLGEVTSVTNDRLQGFSPEGIQVTYEVNSDGQLVRIDGLGERPLTTAPEDFSFEREGGQIHYQLETIASAVTPAAIN